MQERPVLEDVVLGEPVAEYHRSKGRLLIMYLLVGVFGGSVAWWTTQQPLPSGRGSSFPGFFMFLFVILTIVLPYVLLFSEERMVLFERGVRLHYRTYTKTILWQDVEMIKFEVRSYYGTVYASLKMHYSGGKTHRMGGASGAMWGTAENMDEPEPGKIWKIGLLQLFNTLLDATYEHRLEKALHRYDAGEQINFGKFQLSRDGIHVKNETLHWGNVSNIDTDDSVMVVRQVGREQPWRELSIEEIPNEDLISSIITHSQGTKYSAFLKDIDPRWYKQFGVLRKDVNDL